MIDEPEITELRCEVCGRTVPIGEAMASPDPGGRGIVHTCSSTTCLGRVAPRRSETDLAGIAAPALRLVREAEECGDILADAELEGQPADVVAELDEQARQAEEAALAHGDSAWVADDDEEQPPGPDERARRRESLRRMHAGLSPMVQPHEVTYEDEGPDRKTTIPSFEPFRRPRIRRPPPT